MCHTLRAELADLVDLVGTQLGSGSVCPLQCPSALTPIAHIVDGCPLFQVADVNAGRVVAPMPNDDARWDFPILVGPHDAVREHRFGCLVASGLDDSVPVLIAVSGVFVAPGSGLLDPGEDAFCGWSDRSW